MKQILFLLVLKYGIKFSVAGVGNNDQVTVESTTISNEDEKNNITYDSVNSNFTTFFGGFEVTKIQMQVRDLIQNFEKYRAEIALGSAILVASIFAISMVLSVILLNRITKNRKNMKDLSHGKGKSIAFPRDTDMEVNAVLSIYRAKKIEIQAVNNGKASTHRYDEGTDDDEVIYEYTGKTRIVDFEVVNPVYFVEGSEYKSKVQEKQKD